VGLALGLGFFAVMVGLAVRSTNAPPDAPAGEKAHETWRETLASTTPEAQTVLDDAKHFVEQVRSRAKAWGQGAETRVEGRFAISQTHSAVTVRGAYELGAGPVFEAGPKRGLGGALLNADDVPVGFAEFDRTMLLRAPEPRWTRAVVRRFAARFVDDPDVAVSAMSDGRFVHVTVRRRTDDVDAALAESLALEIAEGLASSDASSLKRRVRDAGGDWVEARGEWNAGTPARAIFAMQGVRIRLEFVRAGGELACDLLAEDERDLPSGRALARGGEWSAISGDLQQQQLDRTPPRGIAEATLSVAHHELRLRLVGRPPPEELRAGARLVADLATRGIRRGAFR